MERNKRIQVIFTAEVKPGLTEDSFDLYHIVEGVPSSNEQVVVDSFLQPQYPYKPHVHARMANEVCSKCPLNITPDTKIKKGKGKSGPDEIKCRPYITHQGGYIRVRGDRIGDSGCVLREKGTSGVNDRWTTHSTETD